MSLNSLEERIGPQEPDERTHRRGNKEDHRERVADGLGRPDVLHLQDHRRGHLDGPDGEAPLRREEHRGPHEALAHLRRQALHRLRGLVEANRLGRLLRALRRHEPRGQEGHQSPDRGQD